MILELVSLEYCSPRGRLELIDGPEGLPALHVGRFSAAACRLHACIPKIRRIQRALCLQRFYGGCRHQSCVIVIPPRIGSKKHTINIYSSQ